MSDEGRHVVFGALPTCLHCAVWELIERGAPQGADGRPIHAYPEDTHRS
ncbi:MAG TPA: hypothetical protein VGG29_03475 [Caulobacteraceae bacterium]|jgi:hypothetical protein